MFKLRLAMLGAGAALAFGSASVMAMTSGFSINDHNHGAVVSSAARTTCRAMASEARGDCVSAIASSNGQAHRDGARAKAVHACMQANGGMPAASRAQHDAIVACITGGKSHASTGS